MNKKFTKKTKKEPKDMPLYDYFCKANGKTVEVIHNMSTKLSTWEELCRHASLEIGDTAPDSEVEKLIGGGSANNAPVTPTKSLKAHGKASTSLKNTKAMAAPPRTSKF